MEKNDVEIWCEENNHLLIDLNITKRNKYLTESTVKAIADKFCHIDNEPSGFRGEYAVFSRWLFSYYFNTFSDLSNGYIGRWLGKDRATINYALKQINNPRLDGWRLIIKEKFRNEINTLHLESGIKRIFT